MLECIILLTAMHICKKYIISPYVHSEGDVFKMSCGCFKITRLITRFFLKFQTKYFLEKKTLANDAFNYILVINTEFLHINTTCTCLLSRILYPHLSHPLSKFVGTHMHFSCGLPLECRQV